MTQVNPPGSSQSWMPGDIVVIRGVWKGELWWACPQYIVRDLPGLIALYLPAGTPVRRWYRRPTVQDLHDPHVRLADARWTDTDVLSLVTPGLSHSIDLMWETGSGSLRCWYVQLTEAYRRTPLGFDTMDQVLDIVISPDLSGWRWKDEDEFAEAQSVGVFSQEQAHTIRTEGERVIENLERKQPPFCDGWEHWGPPSDWGIPSFPPGWESVPIP